MRRDLMISIKETLAISAVICLVAIFTTITFIGEFEPKYKTRVIESTQFACPDDTKAERKKMISGCFEKRWPNSKPRSEVMGDCVFEAESLYCKDYPATITQQLNNIDQWVDINVDIHWNK